MWHFNEEDDATRYGRKGLDTYVAHLLKDIFSIFLFEAPGMPVEAFLQRSICELRKTHSDWVRKGDVLNVKPLGRPFFGHLLRCTG